MLAISADFCSRFLTIGTRSCSRSLTVGSQSERCARNRTGLLTLFATGENHRGLSPIEHHKVTLGLASATQIFSAKFYENNASVGGVVKVPGELTQDQADALRNGFGRRHDGVKNAFKVAVLTGGADFQQLGAKVSDLQLIETMFNY